MSTIPVTLVWLLLMLLTAASWGLGHGHGQAFMNTAHSTAIAVLLVAFFKARLVILHFMEIQDAPLSLRLACEAWVLISACSIVATYLLSV